MQRNVNSIYELIALNAANWFMAIYLDHNQTFSDADGDRLGATGGKLDEN
jgi:hypothetical protein